MSGSVCSIFLLARDLLAVDLEHPRTALADAAQVVEGERAHAEAVVLEVELDSVLAGGHGVGSLPADALQIDEVPEEHRLALQQVEAVAAESATLGHDHPLRATLRDLHIGLEVV